MKRFVVMLLAAGLIAVACGKTSPSDESAKVLESTVTAEAPAAKMAADESNYAAAPVEGEEKINRNAADFTPRIIRTADIQFQVKDVLKSHAVISQLVKQHKAYFDSDNQNNSGYRQEVNMVIRVPATAFDTLMAALLEQSVYTTYKNIRSEDITAAYADTEARLRNKRAAEQRYIEILKKAAKVSDVLEVEDKLRTIREEIEATEARLKVMQQQVSYSTINLNIYQPLDYRPEPEIGFGSRMAESFVRGWRGLMEVSLLAVRLWPFLIIWGLIMWWVYRRFMHKS